MSLKKIKKFINGPLKGTSLEIMESKSATQLPDGTPIKPMSKDVQKNNTQLAHEAWEIDVHDPQVYTIKEKDSITTYVGPSIAQEWKLLYQGKRPFYRIGRA